MSVETEDSIRHTPTLRIPLTRNRFAVIDTDDYHLIAGHLWYADLRRHVFYARTNIRNDEGRRQSLFIHQLILETTDLIDHANGDGLDNTRRNLRLATNAQNVHNTDSRGVLPYKGVSLEYKKRPSCYRASIKVNGKQVELGRFDNPISAAFVYDRAAAEYYKEFARTNFTYNGKAA